MRADEIFNALLLLLAVWWAKAASRTLHHLLCWSRALSDQSTD